MLPSSCTLTKSAFADGNHVAAGLGQCKQVWQILVGVRRRFKLRTASWVTADRAVQSVCTNHS